MPDGVDGQGGYAVRRSDGSMPQSEVVLVLGTCMRQDHHRPTRRRLLPGRQNQRAIKLVDPLNGRNAGARANHGEDGWLCLVVARGELPVGDRADRARHDGKRSKVEPDGTERPIHLRLPVKPDFVDGVSSEHGAASIGSKAKVDGSRALGLDLIADLLHDCSAAQRGEDACAGHMTGGRAKPSGGVEAFSQGLLILALPFAGTGLIQKASEFLGRFDVLASGIANPTGHDDRVAGVLAQ